ncbi:MAG: CRISPR-associated endonuclease Cas2 [Patescibacteria group bacterium]
MIPLSKERKTIGKVGVTILLAIQVAGVLTIAIAMPNLLKLFAPYLKRDIRNKRSYYKQKLSTLINLGLIEREIKGEKVTLKLTKRGTQTLSRIYQKKDIKRKWDGKWRIVMFDIWESSRSKRDQFRRELKNYGFLQLQRSVWIYPHDCQEYIMLLRTDMRFGKNIRYIVSSEVDGEQELLKRFGMKNNI